MATTPFRLPPLPGAASVSAALAKAEIIDTASGESYPVMFNPEELKLDQGNSFAEIGIPGLNTPPVQYVRGRARTLAMDLFFDTYETGGDVRAHTGPIVRLLDKRPDTHAPPVLLFSLGSFQFRCVLVDANQRFTMFLRNGTPVRSSLSVRFQEYVPTDVEVRGGVFFASPTASGVVNRAVSAAESVMSQEPHGPCRGGGRHAQRHHAASTSAIPLCGARSPKPTPSSTRSTSHPTPAWSFRRGGGEAHGHEHLLLRAALRAPGRRADHGRRTRQPGGEHDRGDQP